METVKETHHSATARMQLRGLVKLAAEGCPKMWPMHTLIANNPLHDLESLPFDKALHESRRRFHAVGYLKNESYRDYFQSGRIFQVDLDKALDAIVSSTSVTLGDRKVSQLEVLRAHFIKGFSAPSTDILTHVVENHSDREEIHRLAESLEATFPTMDTSVQIDVRLKTLRNELGKACTLSTCLDGIFDSGIVTRINQEMIKWCRPFLDEGHAPWEMSSRGKGFYSAWKELALYERQWGGIPRMQDKIRDLPERADEALLENLDAMGIPQELWQNYLGLHLSALPGWTAFMKWRSENHDYSWQEAYPLTLIDYLAVRLWYEREWVELTCDKTPGLKSSFQGILAFAESNPPEFFLRTERRAMRLPVIFAEAVDRLCALSLKLEEGRWRELAERYSEETVPNKKSLQALAVAWRLRHLAADLNIPFADLERSNEGILKTLINWLDAAPETSHGPIWLKAYEANYQRCFLQKLASKAKARHEAEHSEETNATRPAVQAVFCIDVRSEPFRRHLERLGNVETFGFAGFFTVFMRHCAFGSHHEIDLFPAIAKAKHVIREIPRPYQGEKVERHRMGAAFIHTAHTLLHDLKENVVTPYVMVESIGWFFGIPFFGKTFFAKGYQALAEKLKNFLAPPVETTFTLEKLNRESVDLKIASEQRMRIREALKIDFEKGNDIFSPDTVETLRQWALYGEDAAQSLSETEEAKVLSRFPSLENLETFIRSLRDQYFITEAWAEARKELITRTGFTLKEQVFTVETALRMMGLTQNFARLVLFCAHGSTSDNNPYEASLDCGACGGNPGSPNARVLAALANKPQIREQLKKDGLDIPDDTHFIAGRHDTTTDAVRLFDLQDLPESHQTDLKKLTADLRGAGTANNRERCRRFPDIVSELSEKAAMDEAIERSATWSQTRPEWGLSGNAAMIISKGDLIKGLDLEGRVFLHSYNYEEDPSGKFLEITMTGPLIVAQWINMGYYFSSTDNRIFGSGSKIYHNVVGRIGVMYGAESDLRMGLPLQTVANGPHPFHEPMRLVTIVEAPRNRLETIISRHRVLEDLFHNRWVHLIVLDAGRFYRYLDKGAWREETVAASNKT